jgi:hypothetical protein
MDIENLSLMYEGWTSWVWKVINPNWYQFVSFKNSIQPLHTFPMETIVCIRGMEILKLQAVDQTR